MDNSQIENMCSTYDMFHEVCEIMQKGEPDSKMVYHHMSHDFIEIERKTRLQIEK
jgi:hypothetical protein